MGEFIKRLGKVVYTVVLIAIPICFVLLSKYIYELYETQGLTSLQSIIGWVLLTIWVLIIGTIMIVILSGMINDSIKLFKWLFIEPFKNNQNNNQSLK